MRVSASGNVGIGTPDPRHGRLTIEDDDVPLVLKETNQAPNAGGLWRVALDGGALRFDANTAGGGDFSSLVSPLAMTPGGNVGIGTTKPTSRLQIGSLTAMDEGVSAAGAWANIGSNAYFDGAWKRIDSTKAAVNLHMNSDAAGREFRFTRWEVDGTTPRDIAVLGTSTSFIAEGNVGIGVTAPRRRLQIGSDVAGIGIDPSGGSPSAGFIRFGDNTGWKLYFGRSRESSSAPLNTQATGALMTIQDNGNVGIGITIPPEKLSVRGSVWLNGNVATFGRLGTFAVSPIPRTEGWFGGLHTWDVEAEGTMWSQKGYLQGSDARMKANVAQLGDVLDKLEAIRGVSFERITSPAPAARSAQHRNIGVIAQEVEEVFPELVSEHGDEGHKAVDYSGLTGILVEATKELKARGEALKTKLTAEKAELAKLNAGTEELRSAMEELRARLEALEPA